MEVVTDETWRKQVGEYLKKNCHISADIGDKFSYIGFIENNKILGGFLFTDYDGHNIYVHLAIETPRLFSRKHIRYVFDYGFNQIGCGRMTAVCRNGYERNERILKGTGWSKEGIVRQVMQIDGQFVDAAIYGMLRSECKWIKKEYK